MEVEIKKATQKGKKYQAIFYKDDKKIKTIAFGQEGASDFTIHKDPKRKQLYIDRHKDREDWSDPMTAGTLSRFILWNKETFESSLNDYLSKFKLKKK